MDASKEPSLLSLIIEGLPPKVQSKHKDEAEKLAAVTLPSHMAQHPHLDFLLSSGSFNSELAAPSLSRLLTVGIHYGVTFLVDDIIFDLQSKSLAEEFGVDPSVMEIPGRIPEYCDHVMALTSQQKSIPSDQPAAAPIEVIISELGHHILQLSNPDWFEAFIAGLQDLYGSCVESHAEIVAGRNSCVQDLELYTPMRAKNVAGDYIQLCDEFARNAYIPRELRSHPFMQQLVYATSVHIGFVNDIYSFAKESTNEGAMNPRNLVTLFMTSAGGLNLVEAIHAAIALSNKYGRTIVDSEAGAWTPLLQQHVHGLKALVAGNVYLGCENNRYRHPNSIFPEQRD